MDPAGALAGGAEVLSQSEVERLLAEVAEQETTTVVHTGDGAQKQNNDAIQPYDFRHPVFLSPVELRKLRVHHEEFIRALSARLSIYLRLEFGLQMSQLQTVTYQKFADSLASPCHLTLFKVEPLRGICILDINPRLGLTIVDRLAGGPGHSVNVTRDLSEIEIALLDEALNIILAEWCSQWSHIRDLRPVLLGHDNSGRFLQTSPSDAIMMVLSIEAQMGDCVEQIQFAFPYDTIEPLIEQLSERLRIAAGESASSVENLPRWRTSLEEVRIPVSAQWSGLKLTARQLAHLKVGDVLELPPEFSTQLRLNLAKLTKFTAQLGTANERWAVELTGVLKS